MKLIPDLPIDLSQPTVICFVSVVVTLQTALLGLTPLQCVVNLEDVWKQSTILFIKRIVWQFAMLTGFLAES